MKEIKKIQSSTLLYTVLIAFVVFIILLSFIQISFISNRFLDREILKDHLCENINSYIEVLKSRRDLSELNEPELFENTDDIVYLESENYGAYKIIKLTSSNAKMSLTKTFLIGTSNEQDNYAIVMSEKNNEVTLSGKTIIKGNCKLPKLGVKQGIVNGMSFIGKHLIDGNISSSSRALPSYNKKLDFVWSELKQSSIIPYTNIENNEETIARFADKKQTFYSPDFISIGHQTISGYIVIISDKGINVKSDSKLQDVILLAPYIIIDKNVNGSFQIFASDSIILEENAMMTYPSFIGVFPRNNQGETKIKIKQNSLIVGSVLGTNKTKLFIGEEANIYGTVYNEGNTELRGHIFGSLITERFSLKLGLNERMDVILNGEVNSFERPDKLVNAFIFNDFNSIGIIKELD